MMREILFKAKEYKTNNWVEGMLYYSAGQTGLMIVETHEIPPSMSDPCGDTVNVYHNIHPETVCQYIATIDKVKIWEGDKFQGDVPEDYYLVEWDYELHTFTVNLYGREMYHNEGGGEEYTQDIRLISENELNISDLVSEEKIGNIHDAKTNP